jgi:hypothetical protein
MDGQGKGKGREGGETVRSQEMHALLSDEMRSG